MYLSRGHADLVELELCFEAFAGRLYVYERFIPDVFLQQQQQQQLFLSENLF